MIPLGQNHPNQVTLVASHEDFKQVQEGGCKLPCEALLNCGHTCKSVCHRKDLEHKNKKCLEPCERILCALEHNCKKMCWEECGPCAYLLLKTPPCGHEATVQCHVTSDDIVCEVCSLNGNEFVRVSMEKRFSEWGLRDRPGNLVT
ncbi:unnamed protein product [Timema podura]|uniref:NFX1-type zinc finger-containing protein 1 n=1 Tax=Timema podura TaxID=61482 RepID=A0ABN7NQJ9_TIMPD|nr:unnamed protein product [Timema podura]